LKNAIPENVSNSIIYAFHPMPMLDEGELGSLAFLSKKSVKFARLRKFVNTRVEIHKTSKENL